MFIRYVQTFLFILFMAFAACSAEEDNPKEESGPLFEEKSPEKTGIQFQNSIEGAEGFDVFRYRNYYNGGGVAIGDLNNDSLPDIYLTSNTGANRLYLNRGNLTFEDITETAGVGGQKAWSTGVAMVDINADGWLDLYVCNSGNIGGDDKENELFVNNKDGTFREAAAEFGLADRGFSTHAAFFDFDRDGDLDCYILNNSFQPISTLGLRNLRNTRDQEGGDKLYRNEGGKFIDISEEAGIFGSVIGFGLGVTVGDVNADGWPDIYISNDFYERDYLYINQQDGTYKEELTQQMAHTSHFSMGADMADLNNDGYPEVFVTDMLPEGLDRLKRTTQFASYDDQLRRYWNGFHYQYMRNTLQWNNGNGTFSEVSQLAGVDATDWSWGALLADFDNNGYRDIFVCNGVYKDVTDQDFVNYMANEENYKAAQLGKEIDFQDFVERIPSTRLSNYAFANSGGMQFENVSRKWGLDKPTHSNGAAYGDLDLDGDLDLVLNNVNDQSVLFENRSTEQNPHHYLSFLLKGTGNNTQAIGARIEVYSPKGVSTYEHIPNRGFQSSMSFQPIVGLGDSDSVDSIVARDPYGNELYISGPIQADRRIVIDFGKSNRKNASGMKKRISDPLLIPAGEALFPDRKPFHEENQYIDFDRDKLIYHMVSREGPAYCQGDVNGDGNPDFFIGGAHERPGQLWVYDGAADAFKLVDLPDLEQDAPFEDVAATFLDADGDGDLDLYVASGGSEFLQNTQLLEDRLYFNQTYGGKIAFQRKPEAIPPHKKVSACVVPFDFDRDGDLDLFVGARMNTQGYGLPEQSLLLENDGKGRFEDVTTFKAPVLKEMGMVTSAQATDLNGDGWEDLVVAGDWMPVGILSNQEGSFPVSSRFNIPHSSGSWRKLIIADMDADGRPDILAGNLGLNSRLKASEEHPLRLVVNDFDRNGSVETIFCKWEDGRYYPMALRNVLGGQMPVINKRFTSYMAYSDKSIEEIFLPEELEGSVSYEAERFATTLFLNKEKSEWKAIELPLQAQVAPVSGMLLRDVNSDGLKDLFLGGNFYPVQPEIGRYDASYGSILLNQGEGIFRALLSRETGFSIKGQVRHIDAIELSDGRVALIWIKNSDQPEIFFVNTDFPIPTFIQ